MAVPETPQASPCCKIDHLHRGGTLQESLWAALAAAEMITRDSQLQENQLLYLALVEMDHINTGVVPGQLDKGKCKKRWCNEQVLTCLRAKNSS